MRRFISLSFAIGFLFVTCHAASAASTAAVDAPGKATAATIQDATDQAKQDALNRIQVKCSNMLGTLRTSLHYDVIDPETFQTNPPHSVVLVHVYGFCDIPN
jgi:hypothetical protein